MTCEQPPSSGSRSVVTIRETLNPIWIPAFEQESSWPCEHGHIRPEMSMEESLSDWRFYVGVVAFSGMTASFWPSTCLVMTGSRSLLVNLTSIRY